MQASETTREESCTKLMERVIAKDNMYYALHRVQSNKGATDIDGMTIESLWPLLKDHWPEI